ncbi:MAG: HAD-IIIC family phosphatase [Ruminococcus sp.]|nr:HAD-IIIC family phosphatase [Ruminococcus sp.]
MKELMYPFDNGLLIKTKKKLKRALLSDGSVRIKKKIAVLGGSTTSDIIAMLEVFLLEQGIEPEFYESEYAQYWQDAVFSNVELDEFKPDVIFIHTTSRNISEKVNPTLDKEDCKEILEKEFLRFKTMWDKLDERFGCPVIQNNFELPAYRLMGNREAYDSRGMVNFITKLNVKFYDYAESRENFYINDINYISACYGLDKWTSLQHWYMYKYAMTLEAVPEFAFNLSNIIKSIFGKNKKAIALDLDNTLWGGVVGDDGVDGIEIGEETPDGQAYREFQSYIKEFKNIGVMLTVCSKNDEENAVAGLNHPDCILKPDDFTVIKANWENKDRNIENTASEMSIFSDAFVFLDDNPAERAIVSSQIGGIAVPEMEGVENYIKTVDRNGFFEVTGFSADDLKRNEMYMANAKRLQAQNSFENYEEYLLSLEMNAEIGDFKPMYLARITQLTNKSNQFNLTTKRYTQTEMEQTFNDENCIRLCGRLEDKFGDNGIVSVVVGRVSEEIVDIELWLMSCRVLKRDMELAMLDRLCEEAVKKGAKKLRGYYYKTAKNKMVSSLYETFGFTLVETKDEDTVWELSLEGYVNKNKVINVTY